MLSSRGANGRGPGSRPAAGAFKFSAVRFNPHRNPHSAEIQTMV
jgi:hypothetical protein